MTKVFVYFTANKVLILQSVLASPFSMIMKRILLVFFFLSVLTSAQAQISVGLKLAPALSFNRMSTEELDHRFDPDGLGGRFVFGPVFDYYLGENYDFHTAVLFVPKRVGITVVDEVNDTTWSESYKLQYIQIPVALKMYTDEVAHDKKIYFIVGGLLDIKIFEEAIDPANVLIDRFKFADVSAVLGAGLQTRIGSGTLLETGFSYCRGLSNVTKDRYQNLNYNVKNDLITFDITIKF